ncbi:unnamed protein product [Moneuplotes crassus]|uniref:Palmitoyltransferase n=1 Tax=Euplotes crassus TaxID=5936 RepID=A0AAD1UAK6_EUPCR|nr:unnamed protein product [Moneuplotes crassus]
MEDNWERLDENEMDSLKSSVNSIIKRTFKSRIISRDESYSRNNSIIHDDHRPLLEPQDDEVFSTFDIYYNLKYPSTHKSLLMICCELENLELAKTIIDRVLKGNDSEHDLINEYLRKDGIDNGNFGSDIANEYINRKDDFGCASLHLACFKGNLKLIKLLCANGADPFLTTDEGLTVLHSAAEGDAVNVIYYFLENYSMAIDQPDTKGLTPLHWSVVDGNEISATYLISWGSDINLPDDLGNTPLHLSIHFAEKENNTRLTRILLLRGASRDNVNNDGKKPIDVVTETPMLSELLKILKKPRFCTCMLIKMPMQKLTKNYKTLISFLFLILAEVIIAGVFALPFRGFDFHTIFFIILHCIMMIFFVISSAVDPGFLKSKYDFQNLLNKLDPVYLCPDCNVIRTPNSRHCNLCNHCVEKFDHHCPYLNNCVGSRNHLPFVCFLLFLIILLIELFIILSLNFHKDFMNHPWADLRTNSLKPVHIVLVILVFLFGGFFFIFVFLLFITHAIKLLCGVAGRQTRFTNEGERSNKENTLNNTLGSFLDSEILVATGGATGDEIPKMRKYRTTNDSIVDETEKAELLEGNYVAEMNYSSNKLPQAKRNSCKALVSRFCYKAPSQSQAYALVMKQMARDKTE